MTQAISTHNTIRPTLTCYFVVMIDYGHNELEAIVDPKITRREIISRIRSREYTRIAFIHLISDGVAEDVTAEIFQAAN